jgi:hypothetical protein
MNYDRLFTFVLLSTLSALSTAFPNKVATINGKREMIRFTHKANRFADVIRKKNNNVALTYEDRILLDKAFFRVVHLLDDIATASVYTALGASISFPFLQSMENKNALYLAMTTSFASATVLYACYKAEQKIEDLYYVCDLPPDPNGDSR